MRRKDRAVTDPARIKEIVEACRVCRLGLNDGGQVYIVPMNYGYAWEEEKLTLYFHCAPEGRRISILEKHPQAGFELDLCGEYTGEGELPCAYSCRYASMIGSGTVEILSDPGEKLKGLGQIMRHVTGREFTFTEQMEKGVAVLRMTAEQYTCKELR